MSDSNIIPPAIPPQIAVRSATGSNLPLGATPDERTPIVGLAATVEAILRQPRRVMFQLRQQSQGSLIALLLVTAVLCSVIYGVVVGTFSGGPQLWEAPIKITAGLLISALICLPSLYIFSCLGGSQARLVEVFGLVAGLLSLMTVLLIGFAPVAWVFSQSTDSVPAMGALHLVFWLISTYFGLRFLHNGFAHLSAQRSGGLQVWMIIFLLVALQMTTALRPIVGKAGPFPPPEKKFFLTHWSECMKK